MESNKEIDRIQLAKQSIDMSKKILHEINKQPIQHNQSIQPIQPIQHNQHIHIIPFGDKITIYNDTVEREDVVRRDINGKSVQLEMHQWQYGKPIDYASFNQHSDKEMIDIMMNEYLIIVQPNITHLFDTVIQIINNWSDDMRYIEVSANPQVDKPMITIYARYGKTHAKNIIKLLSKLFDGNELLNTPPQLPKQYSRVSDIIWYVNGNKDICVKKCVYDENGRVIN